MNAPPMPWRLVLDGDHRGAANMARDISILDANIAGLAPPTLRLYGWSPPCLTLGRHQGLDAADLEFCRDAGIDVVRRPTGGRAVLHHLELTYSVVAPLGIGPLPRPLQDAYRTLCKALNRASRSLGVASTLTEGEVNLQLPGPRSVAPCFKAPAASEIVVNGRKLVGSSMRSRDGHILQHGAILLDWDSELQAGAVGLDDDNDLRPHITTFVEQLGQVPERTVLEKTLASSFAQELGVELDPGRLTVRELVAAEAIEGDYAIQTITTGRSGDAAP